MTIGSRDPDRAASVTAELVGCVAGIATWPSRGRQSRGGGCDVVVVATPWDAAVPTVTALRDDIGDKVVVSVANALVRQGRELHALVPARGSIAAAVQAALPDAKVAAACQHLPASSLGALDDDIEADVLVCSDHPEAAESAAALVARIAGLRPVQAGSLASAGAIEAFTAVLVTVNIRYKAHTTLRLGGLPDAGSRDRDAALRHRAPRGRGLRARPRSDDVLVRHHAL